MNVEVAVDLTACDREPIHLPGSIQPHGMMLVADRDNLTVTQVAGPVEDLLKVQDWQGASLGRLLGEETADRVARLTQSVARGGFVGQIRLGTRLFDVHAREQGETVLVEVEPGPLVPASGSSILGGLEAAGLAFERAPNLKALFERAAVEFRRITGFDRVMIYRFLDDDAGAVLAEDRADFMPAFLNHRFPGSDIPRQARALYLRNLVRVIPDIRYEPAALRPPWKGEPLDMSDCALRSVSPVHMQYMQNMGVGASASISIVLDGELWGLIACHHATPKLLPYDLRVACRVLSGGLVRQIKAKEEAEVLRERIRLRSMEDEIVGLLSRAPSLDEGLGEILPDLMRALNADGVAVLRGGALLHGGACPPESMIRDLAAWLVVQERAEPFETSRLPSLFPAAESSRDAASGLLAVTVSREEPFQIFWFRPEQVEEINWAGNPHKIAAGPDGMLTPRASFEAWSEAVHGRARPWTPAEIDAAEHLRRAMADVRQARRMRELNARLSETLAEKDALLDQKELLLREVNHRVQNSLQLVSSFLGLQGRASDSEDLKVSFEEARRRLSAVALVHRRLYRADQIESIDLSRYIEELLQDMAASMGQEWDGHVSLRLEPVVVPTDRAVTLGLVLTELAINANKYAYGGRAGPIDIALSQAGGRLSMVVADRGGGRRGPGQGFGTRMMNAMVGQLRGALDYQDNDPGLRVVLTAPLGFEADA